MSFFNIFCKRLKRIFCYYKEYNNYNIAIFLLNYNFRGGLMNNTELTVTNAKDNSYVLKNKSKEKDSIDNLEKAFDNICNDLTCAFYRLGRLKNSTIEEIKNISQLLQIHLTDYNSIINDILMHGSGEDCIYRHGLNVAMLSYVLGMWIGLDKNKLNLLTYAALLHDIGKTKVDYNVLNKRRNFNESDLAAVKNHSLLGYKIVQNINFLDKSVAQGILMHHEKLDGSGYPLGIKDDKICQFARIIAIADIFDAVNSDRIYRKKKSPLEAARIIKNESFGKLDYEYCNIFLEHILSYYNGKEIMLNNKMKATLVKVDINSLDKPLLLLEDGFLELIECPELYIEKFII